MMDYYPVNSTDIGLQNLNIDLEINDITETFPPSGNQSLARVLYLPANQSPIKNSQSASNRGKYPFRKALLDTSIPMTGTFPVIGDPYHTLNTTWGSHYFELTADSKVNTSIGYQQCSGNNFGGTGGVLYEFETGGSYPAIGDAPGEIVTNGRLINTSSDKQYLFLMVSDQNSLGYKIDWLAGVNNDDDGCGYETGSTWSNFTGGNCFQPLNNINPQAYYIGEIEANVTSSTNHRFGVEFNQSWTTANINNTNVNVELYYSDDPLGVNKTQVLI